MIKPKTIKKNLVYKRAVFNKNLDNESLKTLIEQSLNKKTTIRDRRINISGDKENPIYQMIGTPHCESGGFVFGTLMTYAPGTDPLFLVDDDEALDVIIEKLKAPSTESGKRREFLSSMMHFGVLENHLVLMQSQALRSNQLESFLQWFLHEAEAIKGNNTFSLIDIPTPDIIEKLNKGKNVISITIGGEVNHEKTMQQMSLLPEDNDDELHEDKNTDSNKTRENIWGLGILRGLLNPSKSSEINFEKLHNSNIQMSVTLGYKRSTTDKGQELMDTLGAALRHNEYIETSLKLKDGTEIKGNDLKITGSISVSSYDGQLSQSEVFEGMRQWLLEKISSSEISIC